MCWSRVSSLKPVPRQAVLVVNAHSRRGRALFRQAVDGRRFPVSNVGDRDIQNWSILYDAAVAALSVVCVVLSHQCGFGGYGGSLVLREAKTGRVRAIDFDSRAPLQYRDDLFATDHHNRSTHGYLAVTVPAVVAGLSFSIPPVRFRQMF